MLLWFKLLLLLRRCKHEEGIYVCRVSD